MDRPSLSVIIPVYQNAATLRELHARVRRAAESLAPTEIIFVDDACPAGSLSVLREIAARDRSARVIALQCNVGQNRAVMMGLLHARAPICVLLDADLQDPPEAIPALVEALARGGAHAVFAGRRGQYESGARLFTSRLFKSAMRLLSGGRIPADAGLFLALDQSMRAALLAFDDPRPYVIGLMARANLPVISIPVERAARAAGSSAYTFRKRMALSARALWTVTSPFLRSLPAGEARWQVPVAFQLGGPISSHNEEA